jgi:hypothetical protein
MKAIKTIINDTLKSPNGKWSRKSLTMFSAWIAALSSGLFIHISDYFLPKEINPYAIQVFFGFLMLAGGTTAMTVYEKLKTNINNKSEE